MLTLGTSSATAWGGAGEAGSLRLQRRWAPGEPQEVRECRELCFLRTLSLWLLWGWR